ADAVVAHRLLTRYCAGALPFSFAASQGTTTSLKMRASDQPAPRPMWPPCGLTHASFGLPLRSRRYRSSIGTWVSFSPLTRSIGAEERESQSPFLRDMRGPYA